MSEKPETVADITAGYPDCVLCRGRGFVTVIWSETHEPGEILRCSNCYERRIEGYVDAARAIEATTEPTP